MDDGRHDEVSAKNDASARLPFHVPSNQRPTPTNFSTVTNPYLARKEFIYSILSGLSAHTQSVLLLTLVFL